ncbi:MAG TPA: aldo/keto reductase [Gammaproteobacteria bacterium]|nr:aldo/keto reductase [Gammaproteobacteria bacterium]
MKRRRLGGILEVPDICLGTMTWGEQNTEAEAHAQIDWALDRGIDFIDTAEMYPVPPGRETQGRTETYIGRWIARHRGRRGEFVLASKIAGPGRRDWIRDGETHVNARTIPWAIEDSLKRLQTDYIDLFQIHWPERNVPMFGTWQFDVRKEKEATPILEQIRALAAAIEAGKIRAYGLSNETAFGLCEFSRLAQAHGLPGPVSVQNGYNLVSRTFDGDLAEASYRLDLPLLAYSPLAMGLLSGKYRGGAQPAAARLVKFPNFGERYKRPEAIAAAEAYCAVADRHGLTPSALALAFVRSRFFVAATILGATSIAQLEELSRSFALELSPECLADIEKVHRRYTSPAAQ